MKNIFKGIIMSIANSALFTMLFGAVILLSENNIEIGLLRFIVIVVPYILIYIYEKKYKLEPHTSILGSLGTMLIMYGLSILAWYCDKGNFTDSDDSLAFSAYMLVYIIWIFIPFFIKIFIAKWKLHKGLQETEN